VTTLNTQLGVVDEVTYGTPVTVTRFFEYNSESIKADQARVESRGMRRGNRVMRSDRFMPYTKGAKGSVTLDVMGKGFGFWLKHMVGTVGTTGPTDSNYTHTGTVGSLLGDFFTLQVNRPFHPAGTDQAFTYHGGKVTKWELSCDLDGLLVCKLDLDFEDHDTTTGLATASYPTAMKPLSFVAGVVEVDDVAVNTRKFKVTCDNKLDTDRRFVRASSLKSEPVETDVREITWELELEFESLTQYNKFRSATAAGAMLTKLEGIFTGDVALSGATLPQLAITMNDCRVDDGAPAVSGPGPLMLPISGKVLSDGSDEPISLAYRTNDTTP
jgi:hypothetical protein